MATQNTPTATASKGWKSLDIKEKIETISGKGRFTCIDSNKSIIALGTAAGSIYFYDYNTFKLIEIITNPEVKGAISHIKLNNSANSSSTRFVAASSRSTVFIFTASFDPSRDYKQKLVTKTTAHKSAGLDGGGVSVTVAAGASSASVAIAAAAGGAGGGGSGASSLSSSGSVSLPSLKEPEITCLEWDNTGEKLFSGDDFGNVILSNSSR